MLLRDYLSTYDSTHEYGLRKSTFQRHVAAIGAWERFEQRPVTIDDLQTPILNRFLDWTRENRKPDTFRTTRGAILTLWRHAHEEGVVSAAPKGVRKMRIRRVSPTAWNPVELRTLIKTANDPKDWRCRQRMPSGIPAGIWWESLIRTAYDTGMRLGDMLDASPSQITPHGNAAMIRYVASKTGDEFFRMLRPRTFYFVGAAIESNRTDRDRVWPLWSSRDSFYRKFSSMVEAAGIRKGTFRWIRRTAVTWADIVKPGAGQQVAGHKCERVTAESYRDVTQIGRQLPCPPDLSEAVRMYQSGT